ncbi:hypothetical protein D3C77_417600 [compost metagenome]
MGRTLHPLITQEGGRALLLDVIIKGGQLVIDPEVRRRLPVVLGGLPSPQLKSPTVGEAL